MELEARRSFNLIAGADNFFLNRLLYRSAEFDASAVKP
jgi:hypothetical protein